MQRAILVGATLILAAPAGLMAAYSAVGPSQPAVRAIAPAPLRGKLPSLHTAAGSTTGNSRPLLRPYQRIVSAQFSGATMTVTNAPSNVKISGGMNVRVAGASVKINGPADAQTKGGDGRYTLSAPIAASGTVNAAITLPDGDMQKAIGDGCHPDTIGPNGQAIDGRGSVSCRAAFAAAQAERSEGPSGDQERAALIEETIARTEPDDWPDKVQHHRNAQALHAKAVAIDPALPALESR